MVMFMRFINFLSLFICPRTSQRSYCLHLYPISLDYAYQSLIRCCRLFYFCQLRYFLLSAHVCQCFFIFQLPSKLPKWISFLPFCCVSVISWHLSAVTYSLYHLIKEEEMKPPGVTYDGSTLPQPNANTVPQYPGATSVPIYPSVEYPKAAQPHPNINTAQLDSKA